MCIATNTYNTREKPDFCIIMITIVPYLAYILIIELVDPINKDDPDTPI